MPCESLNTPTAPAAIGPYSQAMIAKGGDLMFLSGQIPIDPASGELVSGDITDPAAQVMKNIAAVLGAAGLTWIDVVKTTVYLADMGDFALVNEVYASHMGSHKPARAAFQVACLPKSVLVEIEAIAVKPH